MDFFKSPKSYFYVRGSELLVLRDRKSGLGDLPGGRMNEDEFFGDWIESVKREISEELGDGVDIQIKPEPILIHKHRVNEGNFPCIIIGYVAELNQVN